MVITQRYIKFCVLVGLLAILAGCEGCQGDHHQQQTQQLERAFEDSRDAVSNDSQSSGDGGADTITTLPTADLSAIVNVQPGDTYFSVQVDGDKPERQLQRIVSDSSMKSADGKSYWIREYPDAELKHKVVSGPDGLFMRRIEDRSGFMDVLIIFDEPLLMCPPSMSLDESRTQEVKFRVVRVSNPDSQLDEGLTKAWIKYQGLVPAKGLENEPMVHRFLYEMNTNGDNTNIQSRSILEFNEDGSLARERTQTKVKVLFVNRTDSLTRVQAD